VGGCYVAGQELGYDPGIRAFVRLTSPVFWFLGAYGWSPIRRPNPDRIAVFFFGRKTSSKPNRDRVGAVLRNAQESSVPLAIFSPVFFAEQVPDGISPFYLLGFGVLFLAPGGFFSPPPPAPERMPLLHLRFQVTR